MTTTGSLGGPDSQPGNIVLGQGPTAAPSSSVTMPVISSGTLYAPIVQQVIAPSVLGVRLPDLQITVQYAGNKRILNGIGANSVADNIRWSSIMPGGHHTFECRITDLERSTHVSTYRYGATVTLRERNAVAEAGQIFWQGYMRSPVANDDGTCDIVGNGWHQMLSERDDALLWQDRYYGEWQPADADGFTLKNNSDNIDASVNNASMSFAVKKGGDMDAQDRAKLVWYYANPTNSQVLPRRFAATVYKNRSINNATPQYSLALTRYDQPTGPSGLSTRQVVQDHVAALTNGNIDDTGTNIIDTVSQTVSHAVLALEFTRETSTVDAEFTFRVTIRDARVNDIAPGDTYLSSDAIADIASRMGFTVGSKVDPTSQNILPLFWQEGEWWDLIQYLAVAENCRWGVWENNPNPEIEFREWGSGGTTWATNGYGTSATVIAHLAPDDEQYNYIDVAFKKGNSARIRHVRVYVGAGSDPFAGLTPARQRTYRVELQDTQPDDTLASNIAATLAQDLGTEQFAGTVVGSFFSDAGVAKTCYQVRAGDLLTLSDFPGGAITVRIYGVDHRDDGPSTLTIGKVPSRIDRILWWSEQKRRRKGLTA